MVPKYSWNNDDNILQYTWTILKTNVIFDKKINISTKEINEWASLGNSCVSFYKQK